MRIYSTSIIKFITAHKAQTNKTMQYNSNPKGGFVIIKVSGEQQISLEQFFESPITKTMVDVKLSTVENEIVQLHFNEELSNEAQKAVEKAFWIGYNMATIENGS